MRTLSLPSMKRQPGHSNSKTPKHRRFRLLPVAAAMVLVLATAACGSDSELADEDPGSASEFDPNGTLRVGYASAINSVDPHASASDTAVFRFGISLLYDRLFSVSGEGAELKGMLVDSWEYSEDGMTLSLTLREDAKFDDGTSVDAEVVKKNLDRARTMESPVVKAQLTPISSVDVVGPYQLEIHIDQPTTSLPYVLSQCAGMIMNPALFEGGGDPATTTDGSGPYRLVEFVPGKSLTIERKDSEYWDPDAGQIKTITYAAYPDWQAYGNALLGEQIDMGIFQGRAQPNIDGQEGLSRLEVPYTNGIDLLFNRNIKPLDSLEVRQAINHAIDKQGIVDLIWPESVVKHQNEREGIAGYDPDLESAYPYDPGKAKELLAEAGYPDGVDLGKVVINGSTVPGVVDALIEQLGEVGITLETEVIDGLAAHAAWRTGDYPVYLASALPYGAEFSQGSVFMWNGSMSPSGTTPEYDQLLAAAADNRIPEEERAEGYQAVNRYVVEQAWSAGIVWVNYSWIISDRVIGFTGPDMDYGTTTGPVDFRYLKVASE